MHEFYRKRKEKEWRKLPSTTPALNGMHSEDAARSGQQRPNDGDGDDSEYGVKNPAQETEGRIHNVHKI